MFAVSVTRCCSAVSPSCKHVWVTELPGRPPVVEARAFHFSHTHTHTISSWPCPQTPTGPCAFRLPKCAAPLHQTGIRPAPQQIPNTSGLPRSPNMHQSLANPYPITFALCRPRPHSSECSWLRTSSPPGANSNRCVSSS